MTKRNSLNQFASKNLLAVVAMAALAGCNQVTLPDLTTTGSIFKATPQKAAYHHALSERRPIQEAFVELPLEAGGVLDVQQSRYHNGVKQTITYQGDYATRGENQAIVKMVVNASKIAQSKDSLKVSSANRSQIVSEMNSRLPGISMRMSNQLHTNSYGPFGFALGRAPGKVRCIYGWQDMKGNASDRWAILRGQSKKPSLSVRLRVCRANSSSEQLVNLMRNLRINADPEQVARPARVAWNAGPGGKTSPSSFQSTYTGYVSDEREAAPVVNDVVASKPIVRKKRAKRTVVRQAEPVRQAIAPVQQVAEVPVYAPKIATTSTAKVPVANAIVIPAPAKLPKAAYTPPAPKVSEVPAKLTGLSTLERLKRIREGRVNKTVALAPVAQPAKTFASVPLPKSN